MNFAESEIATKDPIFQRFIETETQQQRFHSLVHGLTEQCWEVCMDKPSTRLDSKTENCLSNCVDRFLDTSQLIITRFEKSQSTNQFD